MATQVERAIRQAGLHIPNLEETGRKLGEGSYGEVVEVRVRGERYAGKKLHKIFYERDVPPADTAAIAQRFEEECRRMPHLKHRNIVQMIGVHFHPRTGQPTLVMELMDTSLTRYLEEHASVPPTVKQSILLDVASGLVYLHTLSPPVGPIVHRDLTANNILLSFREEIITKIADLGQARIVGRNPAQMARLTKCPGNVDHMPPEAQIDDPVYGTALDIFSFGVVMLHTLAHVWPEPLSKLDSAFRIRSEVERRKTYLDKIEGSLLKPLVVECLGDSAESRPVAGELTGALKFAIKLHPQIQSMVVSHEEVLHQVHDLEAQLQQQHQQHKQLLEQRMSQHMKEKDLLQQQVHQTQQQLLKTEQELKLQNQQQHQQHQKKLEEIMSQHMQKKQLLQQQLHQAKQELLKTEQEMIELKLQSQQLQQQHQQHKQRLEQSVCQHKKEKDLLQEQIHQAQQQLIKTKQAHEIVLHQVHALQQQVEAQQVQEQQHKQRLERSLYQQKELLQQQLHRDQQQLLKTEQDITELKLQEAKSEVNLESITVHQEVRKLRIHQQYSELIDSPPQQKDTEEPASCDDNIHLSGDLPSSIPFPFPLPGDGYPATRISNSKGDIGDRLIKMGLARGHESVRKGQEGAQGGRPGKLYQQEWRERGVVLFGSGDSAPRQNQDSRSQQGSSPCSPYQSPFQSKSQSTLQPKDQSPPGTKRSPPSSRAAPLKYAQQSLEEGQEQKMFVVYIDSLLDFYVQRVPSPGLDELMEDIAKHCSSSAARAATHLAPDKPVLAQFSEDQVWYRAVVSERKQADVCVVTFVDYGNSDTLPDSSLKEIPSQFISLPAQALHCSLHGVNIQASAEAAKIAFTDLTLEQEVTGIVKTMRSDSGETIYSVELSLSDGSKVIDALVERGHVSIPRASLSHLSPTSSPMLTEIKLPNIPVSTPADVCVSFVESPQKFYVQLMETSDRLAVLLAGMEETYSKMTERDEMLFCLDTGVFCVAKFHEDGVWYRAKVMSIEEFTVRVWFVDYGNEDVVQATDLKSLQMQFTVEPCLSIPCMLEGQSSDAAQSPTVAQQFTEIVTREGNKLVAQFAKPFTSYSEIVPVKLLDTSQPGVDQDIAALLEEMHSSSKPGQSQTPTHSDQSIQEPSASLSGTAQPDITIPPACPSLNTPLSCSITHVNSPSEFYCQLKATATSVDDLLNSLYSFYGEGDTGVPLSGPAMGMICAAPFSGDGSWYRAKIIALTPETATVVYIDYGNSEGVAVADLRVLDKQFCSEPCLALKCSLNGVEPVESTTGWGEKSCSQLSDTILDQECQLTILEEEEGERFRVELDLSGSAVSEMLVNKGLAKVTLPASLEQATPSVSHSSTTSPSIPACPLEAGSEYSVYVSISSSPTHLYCQVIDQDGTFDQLTQQISEYCGAVQPVLEDQEWANGDVVLAQFSEDQAWYRARITNIASTGTSADVLFVDFGSSEHATTMCPIIEEFCSLPAQAILCQLEGAEQYRVLDETGFNELVTAEESGFNMRVVSMGPEKVGVALIVASDGRNVLDYAVERGVLAKREPDEMEERGGGGEEEEGGEVRGEGAGEGEVERVESGLQSMPVEAGSKEEVFVSHLESPASFWLQMAFTEADLTTLGEQLETVYSNPNERKKLTLPDPKPGQACCAQFSQDQQWYRSIVESVDSSGVKVYFVDWGNSETVPPADILLLKQEFLELPSQAIHCQLAEAFPVGPHWSDRSITCFSSLVMEKALSAQFVSESSGVWSVQLVSQDKNIATAMMKKGAAAPQQVSSATQDTMLEDSTKNLPEPPSQSIPENLLQRADSMPTIPDLVLKEGESYEVYISHLTTTPTEFYCQLADNSTSLDELMAAIADFYTENSPPPTLKTGLFCVAQCSGNNAWYRAKITDVSEEEGGGVLVHFVDYGNCETVSQEQVLGLHGNLAVLACQAFCCSLSDDLSLHLPAEKMEEFLSLDLDQCFRVSITSCLGDRYIVNLSNLEGTSLNDVILSSEEAKSPLPPESES